MTTQQFIEKAVEGGFHPSYIEVPEIKHMVYYGHPYPVYVILLDPLAWQAVGNVEGWEKLTINGYELKGVRGYDYSPWYLNMHRMIDALADGKTINQFLETL